MGALNRQGWASSPTEAEIRREDLRHTQALAYPYEFDTPDIEDVLQAQPGQNITPVRLIGPARINQLPTHLGALFSAVLTKPGPPVQLLPRDPNRALVYVVPNNNLFAAIGRTKTQAEDASAFVWPNTNGGVSPVAAQTPFRWIEELWAQPADVMANGSYRISIATEEWAR